MPCPPVVEGMPTVYHFHAPWYQVPSITPPLEQPCGLCLLAFSLTGKEGLNRSSTIIPQLLFLFSRHRASKRLHLAHLFSDQAQLSHACVSHSAPAVKEALIK